MDKPRRFSGTHITIMVVAMSLAVVGAPVAVAASTGSFFEGLLEPFDFALGL